MQLVLQCMQGFLYTIVENGVCVGEGGGATQVVGKVKLLLLKFSNAPAHAPPYTLYIYHLTVYSMKQWTNGILQYFGQTPSLSK